MASFARAGEAKGAESVHFVTAHSAVAAGREARALMDAGERVAVFVGHADDRDAEVVARFLAEVAR